MNDCATLRYRSNISDCSLKDMDAKREKNIRLFKIVCKWIFETVMNSNLDSLSIFYRIYPIMCQLENNDKDEELSKTCSRSVVVLAQSLTPPEHMPAVLEAVRNTSQSSFWSSRLSCLEFLQVLVFHNMSILLSDEAWIRTIQDIVLKLMEDERLEVREKASQVLGGLLHCTIIPNQEALLVNCFIPLLPIGYFNVDYC
jgi:proteasome activator subunit 4